MQALFAQPWGPEVVDQGCVVIAADTFRCGYAYQTTAKLITVIGSPAAGYRVSRVDDGAPLAADDGRSATTTSAAPTGASPSTTGIAANGPPTTTLDGAPATTAPDPLATAEAGGAAPTVAQPAGRRTRPRRRAKATTVKRPRTTAAAQTASGTPRDTAPAGRVVARAPVTKVG